MVIVIGKNIVGMPHIVDGPVVEWWGTPYILELSADPAGAVIAVFAV